ncbi:MAG: hypothetical protein QGG36_19550 [Pirellulaceae bacterium]|nr:hypothetical protein [Pirellulaceae bacterium]
MEAKDVAGEDRVVEYLNVLTDQGLKSLSLDQLAGLRLLNPEVEADLNDALRVLSQNRRLEKRKFAVRFEGEGKRAVRVGYIRQTPVWKVSYRLVLNDKDQGGLQGWAIVENTGETDWDQVSLSLVSGRPISYQMPLSAPRFVTRPHVALQVAGVPEPQFHDAASRLAGLPAPTFPGAMGGGFGGMGGTFGGMGRGMGGMGGSGQPFVTSIIPVTDSKPVATAEELGAFFQYELDNRVSLRKRQAAMLPIITAALTATQLSVYTPDVDEARLMHGVRIDNTTKTHLAAGPVSVFQPSGFVGEAQIGELAPRDQRLITYAVDLQIEAQQIVSPDVDSIESVSHSPGRVTIEYRHQRMYTYRFDNRANEQRAILIQHPDPEDEWRVIEPAEPFERTEDQLRYRTDVAAGKVVGFRVMEQRKSARTELISGMTEGDINELIREQKTGDELRQLLQSVLALRKAKEARQNQLGVAERLALEIAAEQSRIAANMKTLERLHPLYKSYVAKLQTLEDELTVRRKEKAELIEAANELNRQLSEVAPSKKQLESTLDKPLPQKSDDPFDH